MYKIQVYTRDNDWETVCETTDKYINDMANALLEKFKGRSFRVLNSEDSILYSDLSKEIY